MALKWQWVWADLNSMWWHIACLHPEESTWNFFLRSEYEVIQASVLISGKPPSSQQWKDAFRSGLTESNCCEFKHFLILQEYLCTVFEVLLYAGGGMYDKSLLDFFWCLGSCLVAFESEM